MEKIRDPCIPLTKSLQTNAQVSRPVRIFPGEGPRDARDPFTQRRSFTPGRPAGSCGRAGGRRPGTQRDGTRRREQRAGGQAQRVAPWRRERRADLHEHERVHEEERLRSVPGITDRASSRLRDERLGRALAARPCSPAAARTSPSVRPRTGDEGSRRRGASLDVLTPQWGAGGATFEGEWRVPFPFVVPRAGVRLKSDTGGRVDPAVGLRVRHHTPGSAVGQDAREREAERRPAGLAVDIEGAAEHAHALAHADDAEAAALRCERERAVDLEAVSVVVTFTSTQFRRISAGRRPGCAAVLSDVRERLLDGPKNGDPLRGRETRGRHGARGAAMPDRAWKASTSRWRISARGRRRCCGSRGSERLAQRPVELDDPSDEILEAAVGELAVALEHEWVDLVAQLPVSSPRRSTSCTGPSWRSKPSRVRRPRASRACSRSAERSEQQLALEQRRERVAAIPGRLRPVAASLTRATIAPTSSVEAHDRTSGRHGPRSRAGVRPRRTARASARVRPGSDGRDG